MWDFLINASKLPKQSFTRLVALVLLVWSLSQLGKFLAIDNKRIPELANNSVHLAQKELKSSEFALVSYDDAGEAKLIVGEKRPGDTLGYWSEHRRGESTYKMLDGDHIYTVPVVSQNGELIGYIYCVLGEKADQEMLETLNAYSKFYALLINLS